MTMRINLKENECKRILSKNYIGHLGYIYLDRPFVVPITYFYDKDRNSIICYSGDGHKIMALRKNNAVALEVAEIENVNNWQSVLVEGVYEELENGDAKAQLHDFSLGVKDLIIKKERRDLNFISEFSSKIFNEDIPIVFTIRIEGITGKKRRT